MTTNPSMHRSESSGSRVFHCYFLHASPLGAWINRFLISAPAWCMLWFYSNCKVWKVWAQLLRFLNAKLKRHKRRIVCDRSNKLEYPANSKNVRQSYPFWGLSLGVHFPAKQVVKSRMDEIIKGSSFHGSSYFPVRSLTPHNGLLYELFYAS